MQKPNLPNLASLGNIKSKIPFLRVPDTPISAPIQTHLPIADITEDVVVFKDGGAAVVMESTSLNFGLLSEKEQQAVIFAYAALINSLSFSIQIVIRSQRKDISSYMNYLSTFEGSQNPKLKSLMTSYRQFILDTVKKKNVLGKRFFVVIPFSALELGIAKSALSLTKRSGPLPFPKSYVIKKAKVTLYPRRDHLIRQAKRLGITFRQLSTEEITKLLFQIYNPQKPPVGQSDMTKAQT